MSQVKKEPDSPDTYSYMDQASSPGGGNGSIDSSKKKRIGKACDSCRIKKCRCDGRKPCSKCVTDNKICVYSERKKPRDKVYPSGYVDLLETRLDLLTKSMAKLIDLSIEGTDLSLFKVVGEKFNVNDAINKLVTEYGLLDNQPVEWDTVTQLASQLPDDYDGATEISNAYAEHSKAIEIAQSSKAKERQERKKYKQRSSSSQQSRSNSRSKVKQEISPESSNSTEFRGDEQNQSNIYALNIKTEPTDAFPDFVPQNDEDFSAQLDLGPFSSGAAIAAAAMEGGLSMSDFESDNNNNKNNKAASIASNSPFSDSEWNGSGLFTSGNNSGVPRNSLFLDTDKAASSHDLLSGQPTSTTDSSMMFSSQAFNENPPSNIHVIPGSPKLEPQLRRSNSKPFSSSTTPTGKKVVNNHSSHVGKPQHNHNHHHHHQRSSSTSTSNPLRKSLSNTALAPSPDANSGEMFTANQILASDEIGMLDMLALSPNSVINGAGNVNATTTTVTENLEDMWMNQK